MSIVHPVRDRATRRPLGRGALLGFACLLTALTASCNGGARGAAGEISAAGPSLARIEVGRLVDVFAWRRVDAGNGTRLDPTLRQPVLVAEDVVVRSDIQSDRIEIDDPGCGGSPSASVARYRFLPFDFNVGHEQLLILWDDQLESDCYLAALRDATTGLDVLPPATSEQNPQFAPFPVVPRTAALQLVFDQPLGVETKFFLDNPEAVQLLQINGDVVSQGADVLQALAYRPIARDNLVIVDTTILGGEAVELGGSSLGLPGSPNAVQANLRIAVPFAGDTSALGIANDELSFLNDVDVLGNPAVIRDFRSANPGDTGLVSDLADNDPPGVVADVDIGLRELDVASRTVQLTKRGANIAIRGRVPFVDGQRQPGNGLPGGPASVPTVDGLGQPAPLVAGDRIEQVVFVSGIGQVSLSAEVLEVLSVNSVGLTPSNTDGGELDEIEVVLSQVEFDIDGQMVPFAVSDDAFGASASAIVRYYENVPYAADPSIAVSDASRRSLFFLTAADGDNSDPGFSFIANFDPLDTVSVQFSEPVDPDSLSPLDNFLITTNEVNDVNLGTVRSDPKAFGLSVAPTAVFDPSGGNIEFLLQPPLGLRHESGSGEIYWVHIIGGDGDAVRDLSGNAFDPFDRRAEDPGQSIPRQALSVLLRLEAATPTNAVGWRVYRFASMDEDGTAPSAGAVDYFGQAVVENGLLVGAEPTRRQLTADRGNLGNIDRTRRGECHTFMVADLDMDPMTPLEQVPDTDVYVPLASTNLGLAPLGGFAPDPNVAFPPPPAAQPRITGALGRHYPDPEVNYTGVNMGGAYSFGGIVGPHTRFGARQQSTYRPDDFSLEVEDETGADYNLDIEQMYWTPWGVTNVSFDQFDRYSMQLSHADRRPDAYWRAQPGQLDSELTTLLALPVCFVDCFSSQAGLSTSFEGNVLQTSSQQFVVQDAVYQISPSDVFLNGDVRYLPYPEFESTYTWRDSRLVNWDPVNGVALGLGGSPDASGGANSQRTANVSSPWGPNDPSRSITGPIPPALFPVMSGIDVDDPDRPFRNFNQDPDDFLGTRTRDHDPIALPLLVDTWVYPELDNPSSAANLFQVAMAGPVYLFSGPPPDGPNGYNPMRGADAGGYFGYGGGPCGGQGFLDVIPSYRVYTTGSAETGTVNPALTFAANGGSVRDLGLPGVSTTVPLQGTGDPMVPWAAVDVVRRVSLATFGFFDTQAPNLNAVPGISNAGIPNLVGTLADGQRGPDDLIVVTDRQTTPLESAVTIELRGQLGGDMVENNIDAIYNPVVDDAPLTRGNLWNPNYACEAYRYHTPNPTPRLPTFGLTNYVTSANLDALRAPGTNQIPRYLNVRVTLENDISTAAGARPSLGGLSAIWRFDVD